MTHPLLLPADAPATAITLVRAGEPIPALTPAEGAFVAASGFEAKAGRHVLLPSPEGGLTRVVFGVEAPDARHVDPFLVGKLAPLLPAGDYRLEGAVGDPTLAALAFLAGQYRFGRYRKGDDAPRRLATPDGADAARITREAGAMTLARDLINAPANDLGPAELEAAVFALAERHGAVATSIVGDALLAENLPMIHAVGRGSPRAPRLIDLTWGRENAPKVTLVGKGVCFDTGGLDIKPDTAMLLMKKDMGGAAAAIGLAHMIMAAKLPVRLRLLVPAVENSVSGRAFRPGDVFPTRKGITVEIGNTDAEGRLILCDALALADEEAPALLADFATLTGAARVALGAEIPPFYAPDDGFAAEIQAASFRLADPLWRLPLWAPYAGGLDSRIADMNNVASGGMAGSITAALFLERFVEQARGAWAHVDLYAWVPAERPGRPVGGEMQAARAFFEVIAKRFG